MTRAIGLVAQALPPAAPTLLSAQASEVRQALAFVRASAVTAPQTGVE